MLLFWCVFKQKTFSIIQEHERRADVSPVPTAATRDSEQL